MTVIAFDGKTLAADKLARNGTLVSAMRNLHPVAA